MMQALAAWRVCKRTRRVELCLGMYPVIKRTQAVPGSHRALPGTHGGGLGGRRTAPTADGRLRRMSRIRKGVKASTFASPSPRFPERTSCKPAALDRTTGAKATFASEKAARVSELPSFRSSERLEFPSFLVTPVNSARSRKL